MRIHGKFLIQKNKKTAKAEAETVESFIIKNANNLQLAYISEEGETPATMQELIKAVKTVRTSELQKFLEKNYIQVKEEGENGKKEFMLYVKGGTQCRKKSKVRFFQILLILWM